MTTLIFPENQRENASFLINLAILFLAFKRATIAPNKLIDSQHYKRLRRRIPIAFHSLSSYTSHHSSFVLICLWILNYIYYTSVSFVWFLSPYVSLQSNWAWKPSKLGLSISFSLWGFCLCSPYNNINYGAWHVYKPFFGSPIATLRLACSEISF